jgi:radical SAM superfamily enzyme YgiQ (UPF0313 family)/glycosyltransferase involved in cell wall biosynthesis
MIGQSILYLPHTDCQHQLLKPFARQLDISVNWDPDLRLGHSLKKVFERVIRYDVGFNYAENGPTAANQGIIDCVREHRPKYVIWPTMNYEIHEETFQEVRKLGAFVVGWFFDDECRFDDYSRWWIPFMDYIFTCDRSSVSRYLELGAKALHLLVTADPEYFCATPSEKTYVVSFVGSKGVGDREQLVQRLARGKIPVSLFGRGWDSGYVPIEEMRRIYSNSRINLCFTKSYGVNTRNQLKDKIFDITMCGGFLLCEYCKGIEDYFDLGKEIVCFEGPEDAIKKIDFYLSHESERNRIAQAGYLRSIQDYPQQKLLENAFKILESHSGQVLQRNICDMAACVHPENVLKLKEDYHARWSEAIKASGLGESRFKEEQELAFHYRHMRLSAIEGTVKILLVQPNYPSSPFDGPNLPLGLGCIAEQLELHGIPYDFIDLSLEGEDQLFHRIESASPEYLGISMMSLDTDRHYKILSDIKIRFPKITIVAGGPHISFAKEDALRDCQAIDYGITHEGEQTLIELLQGNSASSIKGLMHREADGSIHYAGARDYIKNLDQLDFPRYRFLDVRRYGSIMPISSSRGCPFSCIFCGAFISMGRKWRSRSAENILRELEYWQQRGVSSFNFIDSNFFFSKERVKELCEALSRKQLKITLASDGMRAKDADPVVLAKMKAFGLQSVAIGVESANDDILRLIKKSETVADLESCFETLLKVDIDVVAFFIIGLPGESVQHVYNSFTFALRYPNIREAYFFNPNPLPGTELHQLAQEHHMLRATKSQIYQNIGGMGDQILLETEQLSISERRRLLELAGYVSKLVVLRHRLHRQEKLLSKAERDRIDQEIDKLNETLGRLNYRSSVSAHYQAAPILDIQEIPTHLSLKEKHKLKELAENARGNTYVEIGSYLGGSSCCIAAGIQSAGNSGKLYCVDTWRNDAMSEGPRDTFSAFMANTAAFSRLITPLRGKSTEIAEQFSEGIDFLFVDGGHSHEDVRSDVAAWFPKLNPGAFVVFHDIEWADGVQRVVRDSVKPIAKAEGRLPNMYWAQISPDLISVIIPTRNREKYLQNLLNSLTRQIYPRAGFEVIVVDNGSDDASADVCRSFLEGIPGLRRLCDPRPGLHVGRHAGFLSSSGEILVFADDDIEASPSWLMGIAESFRDPSVALVGGRVLPKFEVPPPPWLRELCLKTDSGWSLGWLSLLDFGDFAHEIAHEFVWGCNFAIRKSVLKEIGGFHPDAFPQELIRYRGDGETAVALAVKRMGLKAWYHPTASVFHYIPKERLTPEYIYQRAFNQGISDSYSRIRKSGTLEEKRTPPAHHQSIHGVIERGHTEGYNYHQRLVQVDTRLLQWVLKESYLGREEIPQ